MTRQEISRGQKAVQDGSRERRQTAAQALLPTVEVSRDGLRDQLTQLRGHFQDHQEVESGRRDNSESAPLVSESERTRARRVLLGAYAALLVEILFTVWVSITFLNFAWFLAAPLGILIAVGLAVLVEAAHMTRYDRTQPVTSRRRIGRWLGPSLTVVLIGFLILFLTRSLPWLGPISNVAFGVLSLALPALSGTLAALARSLSTGEQIADRYRRVQTELAETERFLEILHQVPSGSDTVRTPDAAPTAAFVRGAS